MLCAPSLRTLHTQLHAQTAPEPRGGLPQGLPQSAFAKPAARVAEQPLFWADGITRADELEAYAATGLNTVVVRLFWQPSEDGSLAPRSDDMEPQRAFAEAAAKRGLRVIYALPAAPAGPNGFRISASSKAYFQVWTTWVTRAMERLGTTPNLVGWALPDDPRGLPFTDEVGWQRWMKGNYANAGFVNSQWKSAFPSFEDATLQSVEQMLANWRGAPLDESDPNAMFGNLAQRAAQKGDPTWLFHPAALSLAQYKWDAYRDLIAEWASVVRGNDAARPIFSGRLPDYAQLLSLPPEVSYAVPDLEPGVAEGDALTHNPQAVGMARRGGRFRAVPTLLTHGSEAVAGEFVPSLMPRWIQAAQLNGASGVAFSSWGDILDSPALRASIQRSLAEPRADEWSRKPVATAAVVISPLADGRTLQAGLTVPSKPRGLYGFGEEMVPSEPNGLVYALRWGTAFGSVDFLSVEDLEEGGAALSQYSTVLLPCALSLSAQQSGALSSFVRGGGVLVADMGAGALQAGGSVAALPPSLASLFGVAPLMQARHTSFNLRLMEPTPLLPHWSNQGGGREGAQLTRGLGRQEEAFAGLTGYPTAMGNTRMVARGDQWLQTIPRNQNGVAAPRLMYSALMASSQGEGTAFYAPWLMWSAWRPGAMGFDTFHGDLLARNAALAAVGASSLVPQPVGAEVPQWAPVINYADGVAIYNPNPQLAPVPLAPSGPSTQSSALTLPGPSGSSAPNPYGTQPRAPKPKAPEEEPEAEPEAPSNIAPGTLIASVQTAGVGEFLWSDALAFFDPSAPFGVVGGRPAPIDDPDEWEERAHPVTLQVLVAPGQARQARLIPVRAQNLGGGPLVAYASRYDEGGAKLSVWANAGAQSVAIARGELSVTLGEPGNIRLTLCPGRYAIAPRSRHKVTLTTVSGQPAQSADASRPAAKKKAPATPAPNAPRVQTSIATADERGHIRIEARGALVSVEVSPADAQPAP